MGDLLEERFSGLLVRTPAECPGGSMATDRVSILGCVESVKKGRRAVIAMSDGSIFAGALWGVVGLDVVVWLVATSYDIRRRLAAVAPLAG